MYLRTTFVVYGILFCSRICTGVMQVYVMHTWIINAAPVRDECNGIVTALCTTHVQHKLRTRTVIPAPGHSPCMVASSACTGLPGG